MPNAFGLRRVLHLRIEIEKAQGMDLQPKPIVLDLMHSAVCRRRPLGSERTRNLVGLKPASLLQHEVLADVRFGSRLCENVLPRMIPAV